MAYKPPLSEGELYKLNLNSIKKWIDSNKGKIKAKPNQTILYSGNKYDFNVLTSLPTEDKMEFKDSEIYKLIEKHRQLHKDKDLVFSYQTLEDVLKTIRDYPVIVDKDRIEQKFNNAFDFFFSFKKSCGRLLPNVNGIEKESWDRLSEIFAGNAVGDIRILDGQSEYLGKLEHHKILLRKELDALLKNSKLSVKGKKVLLDKITKYGELFDHRYKSLIKQLNEETQQLKKPLKR